MRMSQLVAPTLREDPSEAEVISHKLLLRAGFIRRLAAGVYTYLPLGFRVLNKVANIVREEMNRAGAQEVFMPVLLPAELWQETGRWDMYGKELFRIKDRHERDFCLGPTHEEVITDLARTSIKSYRNLPVNLYQIQTKFRDEIRPRFGLMRGREFMMKDAYSFHTSNKSLDKEYKNMYDTYCRIFERMGLKYRVVEADSGLIGGGYSQEFMVLAESGEEEIFYCDKCNYAASRESAGVGEYRVQSPKSEVASEIIKEIHTPGAKTIEEVTAFLKASPDKMIKTLIYETEKGPVAGLVRGDHALNEAKLKKVLGVEDLRLASDKVIEKITKAPVGFAGPVGLKDVKIVADTAIPVIEHGITGANKKDYHLTNVSYGRDYKADLVGDIRFALHSDTCPKCSEGKFKVERGIEVGHIFKLGTKYSDKMKCVYLDENNQEKAMIMGCYGIGVGRTVQAAIEQNNDKDGIIWPVPLAPFQVAIIPVNTAVPEQAEVAQKIYDGVRGIGYEVLLDDREQRVGVKLKDIDLIGIPIKIIIGKALKEGKVEIKLRHSGEVRLVPIDKAVEEINKLL
ncbi:MAG: proline--tRNA ligase [Candidatus Margulisiibacteriota bacterium]